MDATPPLPVRLPLKGVTSSRHAQYFSYIEADLPHDGRLNLEYLEQVREERDEHQPARRP